MRDLSLRRAAYSSFGFFVLSLATLSVASANVVGAGTQNFNPTTSGLDFVTVQSSKTLKPGVFNLGFFGNYAVNSLPYFEGGNQSRSEFNDTLTSTDLSIGLGLTSRWDVGLSIPSVIDQSVETNGTYGDFGRRGRTETRLNTKYRIVGDDSGGVAAVATVNLLATENDPYAGEGAGPIYNLEVVADRTFENRIAAAVNVGHRWRDRGTQTPGFPIEPMRNQFTASIGVNYLLKDTATKLIGEIFGAVPAQSASRNPARNLTSAEILGGVKHDFTQHLAGHAGLGAEIIQGVSSPDWRAYAGLNFTFGPVWNAKAKAVAVPPSPEKPKLEKFEVGNILFESASAKLTVNYKEILSGLVANLKGQAFTSLTIEGHTDSMGEDEYNLDLSRKRAEAIRTYLTTEEQIPNEKITAIGYGEERPVADNGNFQGRQANRRVEFLITR